MRLSIGLTFLLAACGSPSPTETNFTLPDSGAPPEMCQGVACGLPGQDACGCGATCVDFGAAFGSKQCALSCTANADCSTGACIQDTDGNNICAPAVYGGVGGIYPESVCASAATCGFFTDQTACNTFFQGADDKSGCLGGLTQSELSDWITAIDNCNVGTSTCASIEACFDALPSCTFTAN